MPAHGREVPRDARVESETKTKKWDLVAGARVLTEMIGRYDLSDYDQALTDEEVRTVNDFPQSEEARRALDSLWRRLDAYVVTRAKRDATAHAEVQSRIQQDREEIATALAEHVDLPLLKDGRFVPFADVW